MKVGRALVVFLPLAVIACWQGLSAGGTDNTPPKPAKTDSALPDGAIKLTYECDATVAGLVTPRKLVDKVGFQFFSDKSELDIGGKKVPVMGAIVGNRGGFGMDLDGTGMVKPEEVMNVVPGHPMLFRIEQEGKKDYAVVVERCEVTRMENAGMRVSGDYYVAWGWKAVVNKVPIRILDDNLDGKITQDGRDAIAIGNSLCAQPLYKVHQIGNSFYQIDVAEDQSSITCTKIDDPKPYKVSSPLLKKGLLKALVVVDETNGQVFDLVNCKAGIPAGEYKLSYGALATPKDVVVIKPGRDFKAFTVAEGGGELGMGQPLKLLFTARLEGATVKVEPGVTVVGSAGEIYQPAFGSNAGLPRVTLSEGNRVISSQQMEFG